MKIKLRVFNSSEEYVGFLHNQLRGTKSRLKECSSKVHSKNKKIQSKVMKGESRSSILGSLNYKI